MVRPRLEVLALAIICLSIATACKKKKNDDDDDDDAGTIASPGTGSSAGSISVSGKTGGGTGLRLLNGEVVVAYLVEPSDDNLSDPIATAPVNDDGTYELSISGAVIDQYDIGANDYLQLDVQADGASTGEGMTFQAPIPGDGQTAAAEVPLTEEGFFLSKIIEHMDVGQFVGNGAAFPLPVGKIMDDADYLAENYDVSSMPSDGTLDAVGKEIGEDMLEWVVELESAGIDVDAYFLALNKDMVDPGVVDLDDAAFDYEDFCANLDGDLSVAQLDTAEAAYEHYQPVNTFSDVAEEYPAMMDDPIYAGLVEDAVVDENTEDYLDAHPGVSESDALEVIAWLIALIGDLTPAELLVLSTSLTTEPGEAPPPEAENLAYDDFFDTAMAADDPTAAIDGAATSNPDLVDEAAAAQTEAQGEYSTATEPEYMPPEDPSTSPDPGTEP